MAIEHGDKNQAVDYSQPRRSIERPTTRNSGFCLDMRHGSTRDTSFRSEAYNRGLRLAPNSLDGQSGVAQDYEPDGREPTKPNSC